jgi:hypothetical protein
MSYSEAKCLYQFIFPLDKETSSELVLPQHSFPLQLTLLDAQDWLDLDEGNIFKPIFLEVIYKVEPEYLNLYSPKYSFDNITQYGTCLLSIKDHSINLQLI